MVSANWGSDDDLRSRSWFWKTLLTLAYEGRKVGLFSWIFSTLFPSIKHIKEHNKVTKYYKKLHIIKHFFVNWLLHKGEEILMY